MNEDRTMTVYVNGKEETRRVAAVRHDPITQVPVDEPELQHGEQMTRSLTGEVHIYK